MGLFDGTVLERPVLCPQCGADVKTCPCEPVEEKLQEQEVAPEKQRLRLRVEKRKRGKVVTVVAGFSGSSRQRQEVLTKLKDHCGAGGTISDQQIEIQGDHLSRMSELLEELGFRVA